MRKTTKMAAAVDTGSMKSSAGSGRVTSSSTTTTSSADATTTRSLFQTAVQQGDTETIRRLLEEKHSAVNVNWFDNNGHTALHRGCQDGNLELVKLLLSFGADPEVANRDGWTCMHIAIKHPEIALYLLSRPT